MEPYLEHLRRRGLDDYQLFNAQGNSFDRTAVAIRIREAVARWVGGGEVVRHVFPSPTEVLASYERLRASSLLAGLQWCPRFFPRILRGALLHGVREAGVAPTVSNQAAADGRRGG